MRQSGWAVAMMLLSSAAQAGATETVWTTWVQPCTAEDARLSGCEAGDTELARWALDAWSRESKLRFTVVPGEYDARLRIHWVTGRDGLYGETRALDFHGMRGAVIYVLPQMDALGPQMAVAARTDHLLRDSIVYLTCLHESGHALGLEHTDRFADIMYSFQFGGDIPEYFGRYRRKLHAREDIAHNPGMSDDDRASLVTALKEAR